MTKCRASVPRSARGGPPRPPQGRLLQARPPPPRTATAFGGHRERQTRREGQGLAGLSRGPVTGQRPSTVSLGVHR